MIDEELHLDAVPGLQNRQVGDAGIGDDGVERYLKRANRVRRRGDGLQIRKIAGHRNAGRTALAQALWASGSDLARPITLAPLAASAFMVSNPSPELQPVTTMRLPVRSMPASTLSAVERPPNEIDFNIKCTSI